MRIEVLYFSGCPGYEALLPRLHEIASGLEGDAHIELREVETLEAAERERFLGSPTVRVDGEDIDPTAPGRSDFGLKCRLYRSGERTSGLPPEGWLHEAIARARTAP